MAALLLEEQGSVLFLAVRCHTILFGASIFMPGPDGPSTEVLVQRARKGATGAWKGSANSWEVGRESR